MTVVAVCSVKGAPGATTTALALTAAVARSGHRTPVLVEADPAGGDLAALAGLPIDPGMVSLAAASRHEATRPDPLPHVQHLPVGGLALVGSTDPVEASSNITTLGRRLVGVFRDAGMDGIVDCGRLFAGSAALSLLGHVDSTLVCLRAVVPAVEAVKVRGGDLREATDGRVGLVIVGPEHYRPAEIEGATGLPVVGTLPDDPRAAAALTGASLARPERSVLLRAARTVIDRVGSAIAASGTGPAQFEEATP